MDAYKFRIWSINRGLQIPQAALTNSARVLISSVSICSFSMYVQSRRGAPRKKIKNISRCPKKWTNNSRRQLSQVLTAFENYSFTAEKIVKFFFKNKTNIIFSTTPEAYCCTVTERFAEKPFH